MAETQDGRMLAEALAYAKRGWYVFPLHHPIASGCSCSKDCDSPAKHPRTAKGLLDATRDQAQIRRWWKTWPEANIGVRTGKISGIVVVDTDLKNDGPKNWSELQDVHGAVETLTARTGGGGEHWIFLAPSDRQLKNTTSVIAPGIDTRAEGGYIVAPPSLHISGQRYEWDNRTKPTSLPGWNCWPTVEEVSQKTANGTAPTQDSDQPKWVSEALEHGADEGSRNNTATRLAGYFHQKGLPRDIILQVMTSFAAACVPPMGIPELRQTVDSVKRYQIHVAEAEIPDPPDFKEDSTALVYTWETAGIQIAIDHLHRNNQGLHCEITILSIAGTRYMPVHGPVNYNMTSTSGREGLLKYLNKRLEINWIEPLETLTRLASSYLRSGEPVADLREYMHRPSEQWALEKLILDDQPTILFGPGGTGKSLLALAAMVSLDLNMSLLGLRPQPGHHGIYLDWESTNYEHGGRYRQLMTGAGASAEEHELLHLPCVGPLTDNATRIKQLIDRRGVTFAIIDSAGYACGGEGPEKADSVLKFFDTVRFLKVPCLIIAHDTKAGNKGMPFGSVYWHNAARTTWEVKNQRIEGENTLRVGIFHRKSNVSRLEKPLGFNITFTPEAIAITSINVQDVPELAQETSIPDQIAAVVSSGARTVKDLAAELGMEDKPDQVRSILNKNKGRFIQVETNLGAPHWGIAHHD